MKGKALIYRAEGSLSAPPEVREFAALGSDWAEVGGGLDILQKVVGGYIEEIPYFKSIGEVPCVAFCNEDGKGLGLPVNRRATLLWAASFERHSGTPFKRPDGSLPDVLVGTIVILTGDKEFLESL